MRRRRIEPRSVRVGVHRGSCLVAAAVIMSVLAACGNSGGGCGFVGAVNGVTVTIERGVVPAGSPATVTACADGRCTTQTYIRAMSKLGFRISSVSSGVVTVSVTISAGGRPLFSGRTTTTTVKSQPNGPNCPPTAWLAGVVAHANGALTG